MRRRLRKKKFLGEFAVYGFEIRFGLDADLTREQRNELLDRFLAEAIEANHLLFGGGGDVAAWRGFAVANEKRSSATDVHRSAVEQWLTSAPGVTFRSVGPLRDAHHGWDDA